MGREADGPGGLGAEKGEARRLGLSWRASGVGVGHHRPSLGGGAVPGRYLGAVPGAWLPLLAVAQGGDRRSSGPFERGL
jgi:hypothetical protein